LPLHNYLKNRIIDSLKSNISKREYCGILRFYGLIC
jgi:hypothetical protein